MRSWPLVVIRILNLNLHSRSAFYGFPLHFLQLFEGCCFATSRGSSLPPRSLLARQRALPQFDGDGCWPIAAKDLELGSSAQAQRGGFSDQCSGVGDLLPVDRDDGVARSQPCFVGGSTSQQANQRRACARPCRLMDHIACADAKMSRQTQSAAGSWRSPATLRRRSRDRRPPRAPRPPCRRAASRRSGRRRQSHGCW